MAAEKQGASDYYVWKPAGKPMEIHLHLDVLDRLGVEVMRGFGAVPKRGAEVGGVLIGTVEHRKDGDPAIVRIEDFEAVECEYKRGPSYLFTVQEKAAFKEAADRWRPNADRPAQAIGFYRSNTRDGLTLAAEDIELLDEFFPGAEAIALLIRPYGTKVSEAGFFVRENGVFTHASPLEFPFRRYELTGEERPPHRSMMERQRGRDVAREGPVAPAAGSRGRGRTARAIARGESAEEAPDGDASYNSSDNDASYERAMQPRRPGLAGSAYAVTLPSRSRASSSMWLPLSFVFLLFGLALGWMISFARNPKAAGADAQTFTLGLAVSKSGDNLIVKWDPQAAAVRAAQQGLMEIDDGTNHKPVPLGPADLQSGSITYTSSTNAVKFRLTVNPRAQVSVSETAEWRP